MSEIEKKCELMIIGSGIAGMAASLFAANNGIQTVQAGLTGELNFASGLIDLAGVYPVQEGVVQNNPFDAIDAALKDATQHPLTKIDKEDINNALDGFLELLKTGGVDYCKENEKNKFMITSMGTVKPSYCIPDSMINGVTAYNEKTPCLIIDIKGLKGFSAKQITETLKTSWQNISAATILFPDTVGEVYAEKLAMSVEDPKVLKKFAENIMPHIKDKKVVGLPAFLGITKSRKVKEDLEKMLGAPVFEIPTLPPSIPGMRIKNVFETKLQEKGVTLFSQRKVLAVRYSDSGKMLLDLGNAGQEACNEITVEADAVILATGRFFGKGLEADYEGIREAVFNIPVIQPESRQQWFSKDFFDKNGHQINKSGVEVNEFFQPVDNNGKPFNANLFAAGSIIAHNDWKRMKSGAGSSVATAYAAVNSYLKLRNN